MKVSMVRPGLWPTVREYHGLLWFIVRRLFPCCIRSAWAIFRALPVSIRMRSSPGAREPAGALELRLSMQLAAGWLIRAGVELGSMTESQTRINYGV
jgi:hypothetical protein